MSNERRIVTGKARLSYVNLFQPKANKEGVLKYSCTVLIPKSDKPTFDKIQAAIKAAVDQGVNEKNIWDKTPKSPKVSFYDGDGERPSDGEEYGDECKGHYIISAYTNEKNKPEIVDARCNYITDESEIYSGVYARVSLTFYPYNNSGSKGIAIAINNVQKLMDGEPLAGGKVSAGDEFDNIEYDPLTGEPIL